MNRAFKPPIKLREACNNDSESKVMWTGFLNVFFRLVCFYFILFFQTVRGSQVQTISMKMLICVIKLTNSLAVKVPLCH